MWDLIESLEWKKKDIPHSVKILESLGDALAELMLGFIFERMDELEQRMTEYFDSSDFTLSWEDEDQEDEVLAHIIGLGKREFDRSMKNPILVSMRAGIGDYEESFLYVFDED